MRVGDLELKKVTSIGSKNYYYEIVKWNEDICYSIVIYRENLNNVNIEFVGDRPFDEEINSLILFELMKYGQRTVEFEKRIREIQENDYE